MNSQNTQIPNWRLTMLPAGSAIRQAIECLNRSLAQIVVVVTEGQRFVGTITDGDVRRGLLRGLDINGSIDAIVNKNALIVPPQVNRDVALKIMRANKIHQLPVVDDEYRVVGVHLWDYLTTPQVRPNTMVIMAGGIGVGIGSPVF